MGATIVVGGQFGSEGKGKVVALIARRSRAPFVVRCGGPNSGHSTHVNGQETILRQLPAAAGQDDVHLLLAAGCAINEEILIDEIERCGVARDRIVVDPRAVLITAEDLDAERNLSNRIGSTASGTGAALSRRLLRSEGVILAADSFRLRAHVRVEVVAGLLHERLDAGGDVIVEGTQGFGLSLLHGLDYPYLTSRDTVASSFASEVGLSPRQVGEVVMVVRTFPIRVGGPSGPLTDEVDWARVRELSGAPVIEPEFTSVTQHLRRVGKFNMEQVRKASAYNRPTSVAVMGLDRLDYRNRGVRKISEVTEGGRRFLSLLASDLAVPVSIAGTGFRVADAIELASPPSRIETDG